MPKEYKVFLSYNSKDKAAVREIADWLKKQDIKIFRDEEELQLGDVVAVKLGSAMEASSSAIICVGPHGMGPWQSEEALRFLHETIELSKSKDDFRLIPVLLPGAQAERLEWYLKTRLYCDLSRGIPDSAAELQQLKQAIKGERGTASTSIEQKDNPYRGLDAFERKDAASFFGRSEEIRNLVQKLKEWRFVCIIGPSGYGKSSLAKAGLYTEVAEEVLPGISKWQRITATPGASLPRSFLTQLYAGVPSEERAAKVDARLQAIAPQGRAADPGAWAEGLDRELSTYYTDPGARVLILIDQFEEIFTHRRSFGSGSDEEQAADVLNMLEAIAHLARHSDKRWSFVLTLRSDFLQRCRVSEAFWNLIDNDKHKLLLDELNETGWREAIKGPAARAGAYLEAGLVETMRKDVYRQRGSMPLLQLALQELWRNAEGACLTHAAYIKVGGVANALQERAEKALKHLRDEDAAHEDIARNLFARITSPGEGVSDTRRRMHVSELLWKGVDNLKVQHVVNELSNWENRLIVKDSDHLEVTHEVLIRECRTIREWIEEVRHDLPILRRVTHAARQWDEDKRNEKSLNASDPLPVLEKWVEKIAKSRLWLTEVEHDYIKALKEKRKKNLLLLNLLQGILMFLGVGLMVALAILIHSRNELKIQKEASEKAVERLQAANFASAANQVDQAPRINLHAETTGRFPDLSRLELSDAIANLAYQARSGSTEAAHRLNSFLLENPIFFQVASDGEGGFAWESELEFQFDEQPHFFASGTFADTLLMSDTRDLARPDGQGKFFVYDSSSHEQSEWSIGHSNADGEVLWRTTYPKEGKNDELSALFYSKDSQWAGAIFSQDAPAGKVSELAIWNIREDTGKLELHGNSSFTAGASDQPDGGLFFGRGIIGSVAFTPCRWLFVPTSAGTVAGVRIERDLETVNSSRMLPSPDTLLVSHGKGENYKAAYVSPDCQYLAVTTSERRADVYALGALGIPRSDLAVLGEPDRDSYFHATSGDRRTMVRLLSPKRAEFVSMPEGKVSQPALELSAAALGNVLQCGVHLSHGGKWLLARKPEHSFPSTTMDTWDVWEVASRQKASFPLQWRWTPVISKDERWALSRRGDTSVSAGEVELVELSSGRRVPLLAVNYLDPDSGALAHLRVDFTSSWHFSPDGKWLTYRDGESRGWWSVQDGRPRFTTRFIEDYDKNFLQMGDPSGFITFRQTHLVALLQSNRTLELRDSESGKLWHTLNLDPDGARAGKTLSVELADLREDRYLTVWMDWDRGRDRTVRVWDLVSGRPLTEMVPSDKPRVSDAWTQGPWVCDNGIAIDTLNSAGNAEIAAVAECVAGKRLGDPSLPAVSISTWSHLKQARRDYPDSWYFASPLTRTISPHSTQTAVEWIEHKLHARLGATRYEDRGAESHFPFHPLTWIFSALNQVELAREMISADGTPRENLRLKEAEVLAKLAESVEPTLADPFLRSRIQYWLTRFAKRLAEVDKSRAEEFTKKAMQHEEESRRLMLEAGKTKQNSPWYWYCKQEMEANGSLAQNVSSLDKALETDPNRTAWRSERGYYKLAQGDLKGAQQDFDKALLGNPECEGAHLGLAIVALRESRFADAVGRMDLLLSVWLEPSAEGVPVIARQDLRLTWLMVSVAAQNLADTEQDVLTGLHPKNGRLAKFAVAAHKHAGGHSPPEVIEFLKEASDAKTILEDKTLVALLGEPTIREFSSMAGKALEKYREEFKESAPTKE